MNKEVYATLFDEWNNALKSGDPEQVVALYGKNAVLLPTMSNQVRHNYEEIKDYFVHFLKKGPTGSIDEANIRKYDQILINSGLYTFTFNNGSSAQARFTFVYQLNGERWEIIEHHSSLMPE